MDTGSKATWTPGSRKIQSGCAHILSMNSRVHPKYKTKYLSVLNIGPHYIAR